MSISSKLDILFRSINSNRQRTISQDRLLDLLDKLRKQRDIDWQNAKDKLQAIEARLDAIEARLDILEGL